MPHCPQPLSSVCWARGGRAPLGRWHAAAGARALSSSPQRLFCPLEPPSCCRPRPAAPEAGPHALGRGDEATRLASALGAGGTDVPSDRRGSWRNKVSSSNAAEVFAANCVFLLARADPSHLGIENGLCRRDGPACLSGEDECPFTEELSAERLWRDTDSDCGEDAQDGSPRLFPEDAAQRPPVLLTARSPETVFPGLHPSRRNPRIYFAKLLLFCL